MPAATDDHNGESKADKRPPFDRWDSVSPKLRSASKYLSVAENEGISPLMLGKSKEVDEFDLDNNVSRHQGIQSGRFSMRRQSNSSLRTKVSRFAYDTSGKSNLPMRPLSDDPKHPHHPHMGALVDELTNWLREEKTKQKRRKAQRKVKRKLARGDELNEYEKALLADCRPNRERSSSSSSESSIGLDELESIIEKRLRSGIESASGFVRPVSSSLGLRRAPSRLFRSHRLSISRKAADSDSQEEEVFVPACEAVLDNSKTLGFSGGSRTNLNECVDDPDANPWLAFKHEIVRLTHTLKLRGWRQLPISQSSEIHVERLSGALTNAVYVVAAPTDILPPADQDESTKQPTSSRRPPVKLLLRIYGPNTDLLINREAELEVLRRLAKKNIGPLVLGTFTNGRFEEFLHAKTLKPQDLRVPDTSRQIAKRMRELHDGIELLDKERDDGPFVWANWDRVIDRAEKTMSFLEDRGGSAHWKRKSLSRGKLGDVPICGTSWEFFRKTVERYRRELEREYGGVEILNDQLVFAHNDTQYGNILRLEPPGESPLLLPANVHKQLVVIDFEYANANVPGLEFANHFTEWCYNYHDEEVSWECNTAHYPTPEEQIRFVRAYVAHQPQYTHGVMSTPRFTPMQPTPSMSSLNLDRLPSSSSTTAMRKLDDLPPSAISLSQMDSLPSPTEQQMDYQQERADAAVATDEEVHRLLRETQIWRLANSAQWVVWGILQAPVPGMSQSPSENGDTGTEEGVKRNGKEGKAIADAKDGETNSHQKCGTEGTDPLSTEDQALADDLHDKRPEETEDDLEFDYLGYARDRAMFFWGDCLQMGLVTEEQLGSALMSKVKIVPY